MPHKAAFKKLFGRGLLDRVIPRVGILEEQEIDKGKDAEQGVRRQNDDPVAGLTRCGGYGALHRTAYM